MDPAANELRARKEEVKGRLPRPGAHRRPCESGRRVRSVRSARRGRSVRSEWGRRSRGSAPHAPVLGLAAWPPPLCAAAQAEGGGSRAPWVHPMRTPPSPCDTPSSAVASASGEPCVSAVLLPLPLHRGRGGTHMEFPPSLLRCPLLSFSPLLGFSPDAPTLPVHRNQCNSGSEALRQPS